MALAPVHRLKKDEIIWLANNKCRHGHTYLEHYNCYIAENPDKLRVGFFDIESSSLVADFGFCIAWYILDSHDNYYGRTVTKKEVLQNSYPDSNLIKELIDTLYQFDLIYTYNGCLASGHNILKKDLTWEKVENLKTGDEILAFDENPVDGRRKYKIGYVQNNYPIIRECSEIKLSNGETLIASNDHPWLVMRNGEYCWRKTNELIHKNSNNYIRKIMPMWESKKDYDSGYLAAFMDGEGCVTQPKRLDRINEFGFNISFSQKDPDIINRLCSILEKKNYEFTVRNYDKQHDYMKCITLTGGIHNKIRFIGETGCVKKIDYNKIKSNQIFKQSELSIESVKPIGKYQVNGLSTSCNTYISDGFGSHNTKFDFPFVRTRSVMQKIPFPEYGTLKHKDIYYTIKNKFRLHRKTLEVACEMILGETNKTHWMGKHWIGAVQGKSESLEYIDNHCRNDVADLKKLTETVLGFAYPISRSI